MIDNIVLGKMIKDFRDKKGLTQDQLADMVFVTKQAVSNWERGKNRPDEAAREKLTEVLGIRFEGKGAEGESKVEIKQIEEIESLDELGLTIDKILETINIDGAYENTVKKLLEMTLWTIIGYERYKFHFDQKNLEGYEFDWGSIAWTLGSLVDEKESYPFEDFRKMESFVNYTGNSIKDKLSCYSYTAGAELFEDFDEDGYRQGYPQLVGRYAERYGYLLCSLLPDADNDVMTMYKVGVFTLSEYVNELWDGE